jgi:hypothetical protein
MLVDSSARMTISSTLSLSAAPAIGMVKNEENETRPTITNARQIIFCDLKFTTINSPPQQPSTA